LQPSALGAIGEAPRLKRRPLDGEVSEAESVADSQQHEFKDGFPTSNLRTVLATLVVALSLLAGTIVLIFGLPNAFFGAGLAINFYAQAFNCGVRTWRSRRPTLQRSRMRASWIAFAVAGSLCGLGSLVYGGPVGAPGVVVSLVWITGWLWILTQTAHEADATDQGSQN